MAIDNQQNQRATDHNLQSTARGKRNQQLPCATGTTTGPVALTGTCPSASICAAISCALTSSVFHNLVFRHGLNDFALDENLSLAVAGCHTQIGFTGLAGPLTMQPITATRIGAVTSFKPSVTALAN